jgi:PadR family transcriptional regulator PadR
MGATGELETLILMAVVRLGEGAYGVSIGDEIAARTGRRLTRGAIYSALRRLEAKGLIDGRLGEATSERGGRAKRYFSLTPAGRDALRTATRDFDRMRAGLDDLLADT